MDTAVSTCQEVQSGAEPGTCCHGGAWPSTEAIWPGPEFAGCSGESPVSQPARLQRSCGSCNWLRRPQHCSQKKAVRKQAGRGSGWLHAEVQSQCPPDPRHLAQPRMLAMSNEVLLRNRGAHGPWLTRAVPDPCGPSHVVALWPEAAVLAESWVQRAVGHGDDWIFWH